MTADFKKTNLIYLILFIFPFFIGGFHVFSTCIFSFVFIAYLFLISRKNGRLTIKINDTLLSVVMIVMMYLISAIWAVDKGMAFFGFFKFLPVLLFTIIIMQKSADDSKMLECVPLCGALMTIVSFALKFVSSFADFFTVAGRLAGFFQYSNTFAVFLLTGLIIIFTGEKLRWLDYALASILIFGIFESGSRSVFVLTFLTAIILFFKIKNKKIRLSVAAIFIAGLIFALIYAAATDNFSTIGRFLTTSFKESTFVGRLLYYKDALPVILKHPFGLGYMGYYFSQGEFQTGVYSVMYIHNDFLQILLDIGWVPAILLAAAVFESLFSKKTSFRKKLILSILSLHSLFDFDLQFIAVFLIFILCLEYDRGKEKIIAFSKIRSISVSAVLCSACLYFGIAQFTQYIKKNELAVKICPFNTMAQIELMNKTENLNEANEIADRILRLNKKSASVYSVKAGYALDNGDIENFIVYSEKVMDYAPYSIDEYEKTGEVLMNVISRYKESSDYQSAEICEKELIELKRRLEKVEKKTSGLAWEIDDKPELKLSDELSQYISSIGKN